MTALFVSLGFFAAAFLVVRWALGVWLRRGKGSAMLFGPSNDQFSQPTRRNPERRPLAAIAAVVLLPLLPCAIYYAGSGDSAGSAGWVWLALIAAAFGAATAAAVQGKSANREW